MPAHPSEHDAAARLARAARRAEADPFFFAHMLAAYRAQEGLDDAGLAAFLACTDVQLVNLAFCRAPEPNSGRFRLDVEQIAAATGVDALRIARLVRAVAAHTALLGVAEAQAGYHLAARDHPEEEIDRGKGRED